MRPMPMSLNTHYIPYARLPQASKIIFLVYATPSLTSSQISAAPSPSTHSQRLSSTNNPRDSVSVADSKRQSASQPTLATPDAAASSAAVEVNTSTQATSPTSSNPAALVKLHHRDSTRGSLINVNSPSSSESGTEDPPRRPLNEVLLGYSSMQLLDEQGQLRSGKMEMRIWNKYCGLNDKEWNYGVLTGNKEDLNQIMRSSNKFNPLPWTAGGGGEGGSNHAVLTVEFESFAVPVVSPLINRSLAPASGSSAKTLSLSLHPRSLDKIDRHQLAVLVRSSDCLHDLTNHDKQLLWLIRRSLVPFPKMLPHFLRAVDWTNPHLVREAHQLMNVWSPPIDAVSALELLDAQFADYGVREYAVRVLDSRLSDTEFALYLLQMVQCLKFEARHSSPLSKMLVKRALRNPLQVGHALFWHLKAEMGVASSEFQERFGCILEEYLSLAGMHAMELRKQAAVVNQLQKVAELVVRLKVEEKVSDSEAMKQYHAALTKLNKTFFDRLHEFGGMNTVEGIDDTLGSQQQQHRRKNSFQLPLNPKVEARRLLVDECRFMSSKKVPLWLVFENADPAAGKPIVIIFKSGDDLRQDILTLQLLRIMDKIWLENGLDLRLNPYRCIATGMNSCGEGVGMVEVVLGSDTTSGIQLKYGGGAIGALKLDPLDLYLRAHNPDPASYERAVDNFLRSCAGYCVATFVLGIGDRHNGNIMVTKEGRLFHIDFGHFLGNFKTKFGFKRERAAFVFTPEMAFVMGGRKFKSSPLFKTFKELCFSAFNVLRRHATILENMFLLMTAAGMPELMEREDVRYLRDMLCLDYTDKEASKRFKRELKNSLDSLYRRLDNMIHNAKHG